MTDPQSALFDKGPAIQRHRADVPLDLIFTSTPAHLSTFIAYDAGWLIGVRSSEWKRVGPHREKWEWMIDDIAFVDCEWKQYNHAEHLDAVAAIKPKYCTVRDILAEDELDETLDFAAELAQYAERVIVIPKVDVFDRIPAEYVLGYSVPSSYGASPLDIERYRGRPIHLLGGSWKAQRTLLQRMGTDIVSADLNHPWKASRFGSFILEDGNTKELHQDLHLEPRNSSMVALAMSLGIIATSVKDIARMREAG